MRALICHSAKDLRIETTELPPMGPDQVRVNVAFGGICGSDLHYYQHGGFGTVWMVEQHRPVRRRAARELNR